MPKRRAKFDDFDDTSGDDGDYLDYQDPRKKTTGTRKGKRRKGSAEGMQDTRAKSQEEDISICESLAELDVGPDSEQHDFAEVIGEMLPDLLQMRENFLRSQAEVNQLGQRLRPLTTFETGALMQSLQDPLPSNSWPLNRLLLRKLKLEKYRRQMNIPAPRLSVPTPLTFKPPDAEPTRAPIDKEILEALMSIRMTPYGNSLASRIAGFSTVRTEGGYLFRDWDAVTPWMELMDDIHEHHFILHPDREQARRPAAPIDYQSLRPTHLIQVHDLLSRVFWPGIDVSDSLHYSPEKCTVVTTYRHLVVGVALLSSPQETYLTYLAVRAGWENSHIATNMLYTLISRNSGRDILLHVSANNPAMLLYNRFGFKAEEFIVGFYEDYLGSTSRASKNAFRVRFRSI